MDRLRAMSVFTRIVDAGSFGRAADSLGLSRGAVTRIMQELEAHFAVQLIHRSTRSLRLTSIGATYYGHCTSILDAVDTAEAGFRHPARGPQGRLRIVMPDSVGRCVILPALDGFHAQHPDIELVVRFDEDRVDMVQDGIDCAFRIGELEDSSLIARRLGAYPYITVASPAYLARYGLPKNPDSLQEHIAVNWANSESMSQFGLTFTVDGSPRLVRVPSRLTTNFSDAHLHSALLGLGIVQVPSILAAPHIESGELREILPDFRPPPPLLSVIFSRQKLTPALRAFVDWVGTVCHLDGPLDSVKPSSRHALALVAQSEPQPLAVQPARDTAS
ncbi:LysR family transcriptional regulator [Cupriavidus sp. DL-D2]|uniref:LysR family transcriptional regulator n=1 Tax=Cupriavidus sp. DL-D2 TaxID=3144974 RepID=UPI0032156A28